jgi:hypothetical protein
MPGGPSSHACFACGIMNMNYKSLLWVRCDIVEKSLVRNRDARRLSSRASGEHRQASPLWRMLRLVRERTASSPPVFGEFDETEKARCDLAGVFASGKCRPATLTRGSAFETDSDGFETAFASQRLCSSSSTRRMRLANREKDRPHNRFPLLPAARCRSLQTRNAKAPRRITLCAARRSHFYRAKFIPEFVAIQRSIFAQIPAMPLDLF